MRRLAQVWDHLTEEERVEAMENMVNKQLAKSDVAHTPVKVVDSISGIGNGAFNRKSWRIKISKDGVQGRLNKETAKLLYHEARHAEQTFAAARRRGGRGMKLPTRIRSEAYGNALPKNSSPTALLGDMLYESMFSEVRGRKRGRIMREMRDESKPEALRELRDEQYRNLPEEKDAYDLDKRVDC